MSLALKIAKEGIGRTGPNPSVGCILVDQDNNKIIQKSRTGDGGKPHAEAIAVQSMTTKINNITAYITLEPCCHYGLTPPCIDILIKYGIKRVVIATQDPDARVSGKSIKKLKKAGIKVRNGVHTKEANEIIAGFTCRVKKGRPLINLKLATSLDGKIALSNYKSRWITSEKQRVYAHFIRSQHDAIMVGINTILYDDPLLTCRVPLLEPYSPIRIIMDTNLRIPIESQLCKTSNKIKTLIFISQAAQRHDVKIKTLLAKDIEIIAVSTNTEGKLNLDEVLQYLGKLKINNVLIEGGGVLTTAFLRKGLVDKITCFLSNRIIGNDGVAGIGQLNFTSLKETLKISTEIVVDENIKVHNLSNQFSLGSTFML